MCLWRGCCPLPVLPAHKPPLCCFFCCLPNRFFPSPDHCRCGAGPEYRQGVCACGCCGVLDRAVCTGNHPDLWDPSLVGHVQAVADLQEVSRSMEACSLPGMLSEMRGFLPWFTLQLLQLPPARHFLWHHPVALLPPQSRGCTRAYVHAATRTLISLQGPSRPQLCGCGSDRHLRLPAHPERLQEEPLPLGHNQHRLGGT